MACSELVKVNLTIIIIQRITHAFDYTFNCAFDKSNVCGSHSNANANVQGTHSNANANANANALNILWKHLNAHSNAHSNAFAFVNKPVGYPLGCTTEVTD